MDIWSEEAMSKRRRGVDLIPSCLTLLLAGVKPCPRTTLFFIILRPKTQTPVRAPSFLEGKHRALLVPFHSKNSGVTNGSFIDVKMT